jgi:hypothetical protein
MSAQGRARVELWWLTQDGERVVVCATEKRARELRAFYSQGAWPEHVWGVESDAAEVKP